MRLIPLVVGHLAADAQTFCPALPESRAIDAPMLLWVLTAGDRVLVFDTGGSDVQSARALHPHYSRADHEHPTHKLSSVNVDPARVDVVVLSHLHWDHASNWALFPNASVLVGEADIRYAMKPESAHRAFFEYVDRPAPYVDERAFQPVAGQRRVWETDPAVLVVPLPGHTPGSQGLLLETPHGTVLLPGDTVPLRDTLALQPPCANGIAVDRNQLAATLGTIPAHWTVFPSHDPAMHRYDGVDVLNNRFWKGGGFTWR